jgi:predicted HTH domain antitoxin
MNTIVVELPADALPSPADSPEAFAKEARLILALKFFEMGRLSSGKAARMCDMGRIEFLFAASRAGVAVVDMDANELATELNWNG